MISTTATAKRRERRSRCFIARERAFLDVLGDRPRLVKLADCDAHEGPVYAAAEHALYFTSAPRTRAHGAAPQVAIRRLDLGDGERAQPWISTISRDANAANGMTIDGRGDLIVCEQGSRSEPARITRRSRDGQERTTLVDSFEGRPLNSPNDVLVSRDGSIWFTDPSYGYLQGFRPEPELRDAVYRLDARTGRLTVAATGVDKPNGLALSPDERTLYVTDSGANQEPGSFYPRRPHEIRAFEVSEGAVATAGRLFAVTSPGFPDGIKLDDEGRVYASAFTGVQVFDREGRLLGEIRVAGAVNFTFAGPARNELLITTDSAVWAASINATGPGVPVARNPKGD